MKSKFGRHTSGLDVPVAFIRNYRERPKVIVLPDGTRANFWHPEGHPDTDQIETDDGLHARVRPKTLTYQLRKP